jgi:hypothetical protein
MATQVSINSGYAGALAGEIFVQAFKKSDTIAKNAITLLPNNIGTGFLPKLEYAADFQDYACGFTPEGDVDYTDVEVTLKKLKIEHELCKDEFHQTFQAQAQGLFGAANEIPADITSAILLAIVENLGAKVDNYIWNRPTLGLIDKMKATGSGVIEVQNSAITKSNVVVEIEKAYDAIKDEVMDDEDLVMVTSKKVLKLYKQAVAAQGLNTTVVDKELDFLGLRMESIGAITGDQIFIYRVKNLGFLTGLEADLNNVTVKDMDESDLSGTIRTKVVLEIGVGFSFGDEIVFYGDFV